MAVQSNAATSFLTATTPANGALMRRTLLLIPHEILGIPVVGVGWLLAITLALFCVRLAVARSRRQSISQVLLNEGWIWAVLAAAIVWLLPRIELTNVDGDPIGMAIRGYGLMLITGIGASTALAIDRARRRGIDPEIIFAMVPWAVVGGIFGARLFYVIQYRDQFVGETWLETLGNALRFTEGGLVVYGAFLGGFFSLTYYVLRKGLSWLKFGDVIVPCLFIGLAFGRLGCLMNGCCYGGRCDESAYALHFPPSSPVYEEQIRSGELLGFRYDATTREIQQVMPGSLAEKAGIQVGARLETLAEDLTSIDSASRLIPSEAARLGVVATIDGRRYRWSPEELPPRALPVFPVQLISSVTALLLCLSLCGLSLWPLRDGMIMMVGFAGYAVLRFLLEIMRVDEGGQFGTNLSISQWVSLVVFSCAMFGIGWLFFAHPSKPTSTRALSGN